MIALRESTRRIATGMFVLSTLAVWSCMTSFAGGDLGAGERDTDQQDSATIQQADELVREALHHEIYGDVGKRSENLKQAVALVPNHPHARWHQGYVNYGGQWRSATELAQEYTSNRQIRAYLSRRDRTSDTVAGQLELARWCADRGLVAQQRAHLFRVIQLNPDHLESRVLLGFRRIDGEWVAAEDIQRALNEQRDWTNSLQRWGQTLTELRNDLSHRDSSLRTRANETLRSIDDPTAIHAMETVLSSHSSMTAQLAVETIGAMAGLDASACLARQAVLSPFPQVRESAARQLRERDMNEYVPLMLAELQTPLQTVEQILPGRGQRLVHRRILVREDQDSRHMQVQDTAYHRFLPIGDAEDTWERVFSDVEQQSIVQSQLVALENVRTNQMNQRVCQALTESTGQELPAQPQAWWDWWNKSNEVVLEGSKTLVADYQAQEIDVTDQTPSRPQPSAVSSGPQIQQVSRSYECLVKGTPIWTAAGAMPVEEIQVGDLVLSKNPESGELAFQPVVRTTRRPVSPVLQIELSGNRSIRSSRGHPFWVSGCGWVMAKDLESGMELHSLNGSARISQVVTADDEETYNLVVDRFGTYFVGSHRVLSHDHTRPVPTNCIVPGLAE